MITVQVFQESLKTTIFGMGLVLGTLFILSLILDLMRIIFQPRLNVNKNDAVVADDTMVQIQTENKTADSEDDTRLIAVITAALAQYLQTPISTIKVGTIRKIHEKTPIWGMESRIYNINNKL